MRTGEYQLLTRINRRSQVSHPSSYAVDSNRSGAFTDYRMKESLRYYGISKLLPCLKQGGPEGGNAWMVNVSSRLRDRVNNTDLFNRSKGYNSWNAYALSKLALIHFSFEIDRRFAREADIRPPVDGWL